MKYDFNKALIGLDGQPVENSNIGKILAQSLQAETSGDALKQWEWAKKLYSGEVLDLDKSDQKTFREFINKPNHFTAILKAQALEIMDEAEAAAKGK